MSCVPLMSMDAPARVGRVRYDGYLVKPCLILTKAWASMEPEAETQNGKLLRKMLSKHQTRAVNTWHEGASGSNFLEP